jgi:hypothetical protein
MHFESQVNFAAQGAADTVFAPQTYDLGFVCNMEASLLEVPFTATAQTSVSSVVYTQLADDTDLAIDTAQSFVGMVQPISQTISEVAATTVTGQAPDRFQRLLREGAYTPP